MKAPGWSALAAWVALAISLVNVWYSVVRLWLKERKASPSADLELLHYVSANGPTEEVRVVITNHGPATMRRVDVQVFDEDGQSLELADESVSALWPKMPIELLHVGQSLYLTLDMALGTRDPRAVLIRWQDGRRPGQSRWSALSYNRRA
ncbi:hypothetical protein GCM10010399_85800 [Dactylosporangium fulvum]|uniref:Uncharacterized protein n=1 Tax=Dactylosporangium fulvum TaxID=53359 RepID=A0ABY5VYW3_9ACTN|nr:hypothetical protein [Dactylosporangium fulvum]UWP81688.1 hypothetical protein Dfulv_42370 [Dactylosporangium fulvum]